MYPRWGMCQERFGFVLELVLLFSRFILIFMTDLSMCLGARVSRAWIFLLLLYHIIY